MPEVEFFGERFHVTDEPNEYALVKFARVSQDVEENSMAAMAMIFDLLESSIVADPDVEGSTAASEFKRFDAVAMKNRASTESLMPVIFAVQEVATERPTGPATDSSVGPSSTPQRSVSPPVEAALERLSGRPDMQLALLRTASA